MKVPGLLSLFSAALLVPSLAQAQPYELSPEFAKRLSKSSADGVVPPIIGGKASESCHFPAATLLLIGEGNSVSSICTGSLVHPEIVITAGHCNEGILAAAFADSIDDIGKDKPRKLVRIDHCKSHPDWDGANPELTKHIDLAYCKLKDPVLDVPPTPILMGCEVEALQEGTEITVVGYGKSNRSKEDSGVKFEAVVEFNGYNETGEALVGKEGKGLCNGDSGGPAYVKLPEDKFNKDAGWRVFGVTSYGSVEKETKECIGPGAMGMIHTFVEFVEKESGIDITPCTDAKGKWEPTANCKGAPLDPYKASGSWPNSCEHAPGGGFISSCGDAFESEDDEKPEVKIVSPEKDEEFEEGKKVKVEVEATDNEKVAEVILYVNGKSKGIDRKKPYEWKLSGLEAGTVKVKAKAVDDAGNEATSKTVEFKVVGEEKGDGEKKGGEKKGGEKKGGKKKGGKKKGETKKAGKKKGGEKKKDDKKKEKGEDGKGGGKDPGPKPPSGGCGGCDVDNEQGGALALFGLVSLGLFTRRRR